MRPTYIFTKNDKINDCYKLFSALDLMLEAYEMLHSVVFRGYLRSCSSLATSFRNVITS